MNYNAVKINDAVPAETLKLMHVLSDDTRYRIIKALWNSEATPSELAELLTLSLSTISLQLKVLKEAGIVEMRKVNKNVYYRLIKEPMYTIQKKFIDSLDG